MQTLTSLVAAASLFAGASAFAQNNGGASAAKAAQPPAKQPGTAVKDTKPTKLAVGDTAPALKVEKFIKGDEITGFEKGHVYVVEFWATWCGPCRAVFPHLSDLQKQYKDRGVTFVGVNVSERSYDAGTLGKIEKFVKDQGDKMSYTVAFDGAAKAMSDSYMRAAQQSSIPCAFLVDGDGKVAWIGHPNGLDAVLAKAVDKASGDEDNSKTKDKAKKKKDKEEAAGAGGAGG